MIPTNRVTEHPGEILRQEFLIPLKITGAELGKRIGMSPAQVSNILTGKLGVTPRTAWLLSQAFGTTPQFWMNIQMLHDLTSNRPTKKVRPFSRPHA